MRNEINFVDKRRDQEDTWLGRSNAMIRDSGIQNDGKTRSIIFTRSFCALRACSNVARRAGCSRVGADPREWAKRRFSRRPFQKFRRRHTDSPASSYELASSAQSSFRFFRMEWPAFDPRTAKGCLICWTGRQAFGPRCCCRACSYENWDRGNSRKQYLVRGKENRSSLAQEYLLLFIYSVIREKKKKNTVQDLYNSEEERKREYRWIFIRYSHTQILLAHQC